MVVKKLWFHSSVPLLLLLVLPAIVEGKNERVGLTDVQVLTLRAGQWTSGRRSSPVQQLKCTGGSAQGQYNPQVVQCYNRGSDGNDVQWECKADMDNDFRFGAIQVTCEGYDYPDDPYILQGSCGLEYTLELTKQGHAKKHETHHDYGYGGGGHNNYGQSYGTNRNQGPGFWTGMGAGGLLGYLFGGRNTGYGGYGYGGQRYRTGPSFWGPSTTTHHDSWGWGGGGGGGGGGSSTNTTTGTRTASGFGGTSRR